MEFKELVFYFFAGVLLFATGKMPWNGLANVKLEMPQGHEPSVLEYRGKVRRMGLEREGLVAIEFFDMSDAPFSEKLVPPGKESAEAKAARKKLRAVLDELNPGQLKAAPKVEHKG